MTSQTTIHTTTIKLFFYVV